MNSMEQEEACERILTQTLFINLGFHNVPVNFLITFPLRLVYKGEQLPLNGGVQAQY